MTNSKKVFISHATADKAYVKQLQTALGGHQISCWIDSNELRGGDKLANKIENAIEEARAIVVVLTMAAVGSKWVQQEIAYARKTQAEQAEKLPIIPILMPDVPVTLVPLLFGEDVLYLPSTLAENGMAETLPPLLVALGEQLPEHPEVPEELPDTPVDELILQLEDPRLYTEGGKRRGRATARLIYLPAKVNQRIESRRFDFIAPWNPINAGDLSWYLEKFPRYPFQSMQYRADEIAEKIPGWGQELYEALIKKSPTAKDVIESWERGTAEERRFSVHMDNRAIEGADEATQAATREAGSMLFSVPWEIIHDGRSYLFQGSRPVRVRRRLPSGKIKKKLALQPVLRILLLSPRPEEKGITYINHRISPQALLEAIERLGALAELTILQEPTLAALEATLKEAQAAEKPYTVVHFDGHGIFDSNRGLGALCFEKGGKEQQKIGEREAHIVDAHELAQTLRGYRIPLFFLDACQSAMTQFDPATSVAATLLEDEVAAVAAMSHSVLVETAKRFAIDFYQSLANGARIGSAMLAGQQALHRDALRAHLPQGRKLELQDWFVPVLYQEEEDLQIIRRRPTPTALQAAEKISRSKLGALPDEPLHTFVGRSRELLHLERSLAQHRWVSIRGTGGVGKTTIASELARWLVRTSRFEQAAFLSFEYCRDVRTAIDQLGRQLLPDQPDWSVAKFKDNREAFQHLARAMKSRSTLIICDNMESILPDSKGEVMLGIAPIEAYLAFYQQLLDAAPTTRLIFTTRERLPTPFSAGKQEVNLGKLRRTDALELVAQVMNRENVSLSAEDNDTREKAFGRLIDAANAHARALTLLSQELARRAAINPNSLADLTSDLEAIMAKLEHDNAGDRENSLFASLELSLNRLPEEMHEQVNALAIFHGGVHWVAWAYVAEVEDKEIVPVANALVSVGLANWVHEAYLKFDPALAAYLQLRLSPEQQEKLLTRWRAIMGQMVNFLHDEWFKDAKLAADLALLQETDILAYLTGLSQSASPEEIIGTTDSIERLYANLNRPVVMAFAANIRQAAAERIGEWNHTAFWAEANKIKRLEERGQLAAAYQLAVELFKKTEVARESAYSNAAYDMANIRYILGNILQKAGQVEQALPLLEDAKKRFEAQEETRMASVSLTLIADCYKDTGKLDEAVKAYEETISLATERNDYREIAVNKGQWADVKRRQKEYQSALDFYQEVKAIFTALGEDKYVAVTWHQMGVTYQDAGRYTKAEQAYLQSLQIKTQTNDKSGEASTLGQLGIFYSNLNRLEDAVNMHKKAILIYEALKDKNSSGIVHSNLAIQLIKLQNYNEARAAITKAIAYKQELGLAAEPWKSWHILYDLEIACNNTTAATQARQEAIAAYTAYRQQNGSSTSNRYHFYVATYQAVKTQTTAQAIEELKATLEDDIPKFYVATITQLIVVLQGQRELELAEHPDLHYMAVVELRLLLEQLREEGL